MRLHLVVPGLLRLEQTSSPTREPLQVAALAKLLGRGHSESRPAVTLDQWLAHAFGIDDPDPPYAALRLAGTGNPPGDAHWICADPVHVRFARDTLVVGAADEVQLSQDDAQTLVDALNAHFSDLGRFTVETPVRWSLRLNRALAVRTHPLELVRGRPMEPFLPQGEDGRLLVRTLNEIQMLLHGHAVNTHREMTGLPTANSVWFWGEGQVPARLEAPADVLTADHPVARGLARLAGMAHRGLPTRFEEVARGEGRHLVVIDALTAAAQERDEARWQDTLARLEEDWFAPALRALKSGKVKDIAISALQDEALVNFCVERADLWKVWRRSMNPARPASSSPAA